MSGRWDDYFMNQAKMVSTNSTCRSRKIGAVLVKDKRVVGTGYNGPPAGVRPCDQRWIEDGLYDEHFPGGVLEIAAVGQCPLRILEFKSGEGLHLCVAGHAERNALLSAARIGTSTVGTTLYCYCGQVCKDCAIEIINAGVEELVFLSGRKDYDDLGGLLLEEADIKVRRIDDNTMRLLPPEGRVFLLPGRGSYRVENLMEDEGIEFEEVK